MEKKLVNSLLHTKSVASLEGLYAGQQIPAEKKPFLISLRESSGPLMAVDGGDVILDVASQIASLALGFNPGVMFGTVQFLESWTGATNTIPIKTVRQALAALLARQLGWNDLNMHLCHSGAEANECALGMCYARRTNRDARHVLAFRQSFHGRMMVALSATWNPAKREPFAWPNCEADYVDYPEMPDGDDASSIVSPADWQALWACAPRIDFEQQLNRAFPQSDSLLTDEIKSLLQVRNYLGTRRHFAVIIEPMQCEGGDRYSSSRFHNGLLAVCKAFQIPLIYDEIQTGYGLGGDFFWHRKFDLRDHRGDSSAPDYVVVAKKAQVGAVLSHHKCEYEEQFNAASLVRGFAQASMIDQYRGEIAAMEVRNRRELAAIVEEFGPALSRPRVCGISFAFEFANAETSKRFVEQRFQHGLLYYPAGDRAARFRFNLAFRGKWLDVAWQQIRAALHATLKPSADPTTVDGNRSTSVEASSTRSYRDFHLEFLRGKLTDLAKKPFRSIEEAKAFVQESLNRTGPGQLIVNFLDEESWPDYRDAVERLQHEIYEPLRQTPIEKFDRLIKAKNSSAIAVTSGDRVVAMAFAAPLANFPRERGMRGDELFKEPLATYMLDLTVVPEYRGQLGRIMKQAVCLVAQTTGMKHVVGRNRDRLARGMWAINLSLGSYITRVIREDYLDDQSHRDCLIYRSDLVWDEPAIDLSSAVPQPMDCIDLSESFVQTNMPSLVNKLTLSNFVTPDFVENLNFVFSLLPESLRHGYTTSGISECVDKLIKVLWLKRKPHTRMITIEGSYFGEGSFAARALSGCTDAYFPVEIVPFVDDSQCVSELEVKLAAPDTLAMWVEPLGWKTGRRLSPELLQSIRKLCRRFDVPLVSHDSGGLFYRFEGSSFAPSGMDGLVPDAGLMSLGGQMALCYTTDRYFDSTPLQFISTWDGDVFSLAQFCEIARRTVGDRTGFELLIEQFERLLLGKLAENDVSQYDLYRGTGSFQGPVESSLSEMFQVSGAGRHVCLACPGAMRRFIEWAIR